MDQLIAKSQEQYIDSLMTQRRVLDEIRDDTKRWYTDLHNPPSDTGWVDISMLGSVGDSFGKRHLRLVRDEGDRK